MKPYHKIQSIYRRHRDGPNRGAFIDGAWSTPELEYMAHCQWSWSEKLDGTNIRIWSDGGELRVAGKTDNAQMFPGVVESVRASLRGRLVPEGYCIYGEGIGPKIQRGHGYGETRVVAFDVWCGGYWLEEEDAREVVSALGLQFCGGEYGVGDIFEAIEQVADPGFRSCHGSQLAEGLILRPLVRLQDARGGRIIAKVKRKDVLRMWGEL